jgi:N-carbamoylputrescine amidase
MVRIALIQNKPRKGAIAENLRAAGEAFAMLASGEPPDLVVLPEAALTGYFLEGGVYEKALAAGDLVRMLAERWRSAAGSRAVDIVCGFYENADGTYYNSALYCTIADGDARIVHIHRKLFLPTYGVFDEERFLSRGRKLQAFPTRFGSAAILICEDAWHAIVPTIAALKGARVLIVPSASPGRGIEGRGELTSVTLWREVLRAVAREHGLFVLYAGMVGFEGGKGMTGSSCVIDPFGNEVVRASDDEPCVVRCSLDMRDVDLARAQLPLLGDLGGVLADLLLDAELPLPRPIGDVDARRT